MDEFDLLAGGGDSTLDGGGDEFDRLAGAAPITPKSEILPSIQSNSRPDSSSIRLADNTSLGDVFRPVVRGGARGLAGLGTIAPELLLSGGKALIEKGPGMLASLGNPSGNAASRFIDRKLKGAVPYDYFGFSQDYMDTVNKEIIDPIVPPQETDVPFVETFSEYAAPGLGMYKLFKNAPLLGKLFGPKKAEVASILAGSTAAAGAEEFSDNPYVGPAASVLAGSAAYRAMRAPNVIKETAEEIAKSGTRRANELADQAKDFGPEAQKQLTAKAQEVADKTALKRLEAILGPEGLDDIEAGLIARQDLPPEAGARQYATVGEKLDNRELLGVEEVLAKDTIVGEKARLARDAAKSKARLGEFQGGVAHIDDPAELAVGGLSREAKLARDTASDLFDEIDPEGVSRIPIGPQQDDVVRAFNSKYPDGLDGTAQTLVNKFTSGNAIPGRTLEIREKVSYPLLTQWRSKASAVVRESPGTPEANMMREHLIPAIDEAMETAATTGKGFSPAQQQKYKEANRLWREYKGKYGKNTIAGKTLRPDDAAGKIEPSQLAPKILAKGTPKEQALRLANTVDPKDHEAWRANLLDQVLDDATDGEVVNFKKLAQGVDRIAERSGGIFSPEHKEALGLLSEEIAKSRRQGAEGKAFARTKIIGARGEQNMLDYARQIYASRLGWKYPIQRKIIQLASKGKQLNEVSLEELVDSVLVEFSKDEKFAIQLLEKRSTKDFQKFLKTPDGLYWRDKLGKAFEAVQGKLGKAANMAKIHGEKEAVKRTGQLFGPLGVKAGEKGKTAEEKTLDLEKLLGPRPNEARGLFSGKEEPSSLFGGKNFTDAAVRGPGITDEPESDIILDNAEEKRTGLEAGGVLGGGDGDVEEGPIKPHILKAVRIVESNDGDPNFLKSGAGAEGPYQLMPKTGARIHKRLGLEDPYDPYDEEQAKQIASHHLEDGLRRFGSIELALADYNAGHTLTSAAIKRAGSKEWPAVEQAFRDVGNTETADYVKKIYNALETIA
jgi:hypothetical protein